MSGWWRSLFGRGALLHPFEQAAIADVAGRLGAPGAKLLAQAGAVNEVQRLGTGKEVNLYTLRNGKPAFDDALRFTGLDDDVLLATVMLAASGGARAQLKLELWLANGRLFSLVYDKPPAKVLGADLDRAAVSIEDVCVWIDPGRPDAAPAAGGAGLSGWVAEWRQQGRLTNLRPPLASRQREQLLRTIGARLPADYLEFVAQADGADAGAVRIHGPRAIREVAADRANFYILAEDAHRGLAVPVGSDTADLVSLDFENDRQEPAGRLFQSALLAMTGG